LLGTLGQILGILASLNDVQKSHGGKKGPENCWKTKSHDCTEEKPGFLFGHIPNKIFHKARAKLTRDYTINKT